MSFIDVIVSKDDPDGQEVIETVQTAGLALEDAHIWVFDTYKGTGFNAAALSVRGHALQGLQNIKEKGSLYLRTFGYTK